MTKGKRIIKKNTPNESDIDISEYSPIVSPNKLLNLEGIKVGRLLVLKPLGIKNRYVYWLCKCDCGNFTSVRASHLKAGSIRSCGCLVDSQTYTHRKTNHPLYRVWRRMINRCNNPNHQHYKSYGGRGIKVCDEWLGKDGFQNFYEWAMANGYCEDLTIDRIDVNGNYEPLNCRWATNLEQQNNKRNNVFWEYNGEMHTIAEWSRILNVNEKTIATRLHKGWSLDDAFLTPIKERK